MLLLLPSLYCVLVPSYLPSVLFQHVNTGDHAGLRLHGGNAGWSKQQRQRYRQSGYATVQRERAG